MTLRRTVAVLFLLVACGGGSPVTVPSATSASDSLPPSDQPTLAAAFDPTLATFGLRTQRGGVYVSSAAEGTQLNIYAAPITALDADDYVARLVPVLAATVPQSFARWAGLDAVDICLEPVTATDAAEPPPETRVVLTREQAAAVDWSTFDSTALLRAAHASPRGVTLLQISNAIAATDAWQSVVRSVG